MADYKTIMGEVAFAPRVNDNAGGKKVKNLVVNLANSVEDTKFDVALWEDMAAIEVSQGDFVLAKGSYSQDTYNGEARHKLSALSIVVLTPTQASKRESNGSAPAAAGNKKKVSY